MVIIFFLVCNFFQHKLQVSAYLLKSNQDSGDIRLYILERLSVRAEGELHPNLEQHPNNGEMKTVRWYITMIVVTTTVRFSMAELSLDRAFSFWTNTSLSMSFQ